MLQRAEPTPAGRTGTPDVLKGVGLGALGYTCFALQDATVKWLAAHYAVPEILLLRSLVIVAVALAIGRGRDLGALRRSPSKGSIALRAALMLTAWLFYYNAATRLPLGQLTTLYFAAPIVAVLLSVPILRERVDAARWLAVLVGFAGVVVAADPAAALDLVPAGMALFAACCWGLSVVLARLIGRTETTANQMLVTNALFAVACALLLIGGWRTPDPFDFALMVGLGVAGGLGQFFLYEGFRFAPASVLAPIEYTGLVWAFLFGYAIWAEVPGLNVFAGAALIVGGSLGLVWIERRRAARPDPAVRRT